MDLELVHLLAMQRTRCAQLSMPLKEFTDHKRAVDSGFESINFREEIGKIANSKFLPTLPNAERRESGAQRYGAELAVCDHVLYYITLGHADPSVSGPQGSCQVFS